MSVNFEIVANAIITDRIVNVAQLRCLRVTNELHRTLVQLSPNIVHPSRDLYSPLEIVKAIKDIVKLEPGYVMIIERFTIRNPTLVRILGESNFTDIELLCRVLELMIKLQIPLTTNEQNETMVLVSTSIVNAMRGVIIESSIPTAQYVTINRAGIMIQTYVDALP